MSPAKFFIKTGELFSLAGLLSLLFFFPPAAEYYQMPKAAGAVFFFSLSALFAAVFSRRPVTPAALFTLLLTAAVLLSIVFSKRHLPVHYILTLLSPVFFFASKISFKKLLVFLNLLFFISAVYAVFQFSSFSTFSTAGRPRPYSFFGNPVLLGEFTAVLLPFLICAFYLFKNFRLAVFINILLALLTLILTAPRGAIVSAFVSCALLLFLYRGAQIKSGVNKKTAFMYAGAFGIFLISILTIPSFSGALKGTASRLAAVTSAADPGVLPRVYLAKAAMNIFLAYPLAGAGLGAFREDFPAYAQKDANTMMPAFSTYVHNDYLQLLSETGILGLLLFFLPVLFVLLALQKYMRAASPQDYAAGAAIICALSCVLFEAFFNFPLFSMPCAALFWFLCGMADNIRPAAPVKTRSNLIFVAAPVFALLILFMSVKPLASLFYEGRGLYLTERNRPGSDFFLIRAVELSPASFSARCALGLNYSKYLQYSQAIKEYEAALAIKPYSADIMYNLALLSGFNSDNAAKEKYLTASLALKPDFVKARLSLAELFLNSGRQDQSFEQTAIAKLYTPENLMPQIEKDVLTFHEATYTLGEWPGDKTR